VAVRAAAEFVVGRAACGGGDSGAGGGGVGRGVPVKLWTGLAGLGLLELHCGVVMSLCWAKDQ
jgi:hypothetical protein